MKINHYEQNIPEGVEIVEIKLTHGQVRRCICRYMKTYFFYDDHGQAYSLPNPSCDGDDPVNAQAIEEARERRFPKFDINVKIGI